jgi:hypothetical protein
MQKEGVMRFKSELILSFFVLGIFSLLLCKPEQALAQQSEEEIMQKTEFSCELIKKIKPEKIVEHKRNLAVVLVKVRDKLIEHFNKGTEESFREMGVLLASKGAVLEDIGEKYKWVYGEEPIAGLFKSLSTKSEAELDIEIRHIFIDKIFEKGKVGITKEEEVNMVARIIFIYHLNHREGNIMKNSSGTGDFGCLHRHDCPWCID